MTSIQDALKRMRENMQTVPNGTFQKEQPVCSQDCPICGGAGVYRLDVDRHHPDFGRIFPCTNLPQDKRHTLHPCGLYLDDMDTLSWSTVKPYSVQLTYRNRTSTTTMDKISAFLAKYISNGYGLVFIYGGYGHGKSLLIQIAVAEAVRKQRMAVYARATDILDDIRQGYDVVDPRDGPMYRVRRLLEIPLLSIDELDKINITDWTAERLFNFIDKRYEDAMHRKSLTLIASNHRPGDISQGIASRVLDGRCLYMEIAGDDIRPKMTW